MLICIEVHTCTHVNIPHPFSVGGCWVGAEKGKGRKGGCYLDEKGRWAVGGVRRWYQDGEGVVTN